MFQIFGKKIPVLIMVHDLSRNSCNRDLCDNVITQKIETFIMNVVNEMMLFMRVCNTGTFLW